MGDGSGQFVSNHGRLVAAKQMQLARASLQCQWGWTVFAMRSVCVCGVGVNWRCVAAGVLQEWLIGLLSRLAVACRSRCGMSSTRVSSLLLARYGFAPAGSPGGRKGSD